MSNDKYIWMDVHQASIVCAAHSREGKCIEKSNPPLSGARRMFDAA